MIAFDGIKIFSATKARDRHEISSRINDWISEHRDEYKIVNAEVHQSSDNAYHCLTITIYYCLRD